ncbi:LacI family DNA-binding transcriptional regulator [Pseudolysinimonas sp.]|uniref:LacI family DNA-binding transcriptional regulator n=1 Tax=Pseudolysinimonas sp. TaxID=2680009 RepID=UPI003F81A03A
MATLADVAARAGVSISAASRVLSNAPDARVGEGTRRRIQEAAAELGYRPNSAARALKSARSEVVALVVPDLTNAIFSELMRGVETRAAELGYLVLLARAEGMERGDEALGRLLGEGRVDGVVVQVGDAMDLDGYRDVLAGRVPAVLVNSRRGADVASVILDDQAATRRAVEHLVALGHGRIAYAGGLPGNDSAARRAEGFAEGMAAADLPVDARLVTDLGYTPQQGREAIARLLEAGSPPPTAVVVANVNAALGALLEARTRGLRVPEELSLVAVHDAWPAENTWPPLTTVRMPLYELGVAAMDGVYARIRRGELVHTVVRDPAPRLVVRGSTAPPRAD